MNKGLKILALCLCVLLLLILGLALYSNLVEGRSFQSWVVERFLWLHGNPAVPKSTDSFEALLQERGERNELPATNPDSLLGQSVEEVYIEGMQCFVWNDKQSPTQKTILYLHGGGYLSPPMDFHYVGVNKIATAMDAKVVFPIYPRVPRHSYKDAMPKLLGLYESLLATKSSKTLNLMGDSSGGGLALGLAMYIRDQGLPQPKEIILISPWLDVHTNHPDIAKYEDLDPMLNAWWLKQMGLLWAGSEEDMANPYVSPLFGNLEGLGHISIFVGNHEIFLPDNEALHHKLMEQNIDHNFVVADKMNHAYVIFPIPEADKVQLQIIEILRK